MRVFKVVESDRHEWLEPEDQEEYGKLRVLTGEPDTEWRPLRVTRITKDTRGRLADSDFPLLSGHALTLRRKAADILSDMIRSNGSQLPLQVRDGAEMTLFVPRPIDALDEGKSEIRRYPSSGKIMLVKRAGFLPERLVGIDIFRLSHQGSSIYVTGDFVNRVNTENLRGLEFVEQ